MDVLDNDYVTAARTPDGTWPSSTRRPVPMSASFTPPGRNAAGAGDWLLVLSG